MSLIQVDESEVVHVRELFPITVQDYQRMIQSGILPDGGPYELLDGMIFRKDRSGPSKRDGHSAGSVNEEGEVDLSHSPRHRRGVRKLIALAARIDTPHRHLQVQLPIEIGGHSSPEPDGAVILGSDDVYADRLPTESDVVCIIEIAESSLAQDRLRKGHAYAAAGIPQYVLINLIDSQVEVYTQPRDAGYQSKQIVKPGDTVSLHLGPAHNSADHSSVEYLPVPASELLG